MRDKGQRWRVGRNRKQVEVQKEKERTGPWLWQQEKETHQNSQSKRKTSKNVKTQHLYKCGLLYPLCDSTVVYRVITCHFIHFLSLSLSLCKLFSICYLFMLSLSISISISATLSEPLLGKESWVWSLSEFLSRFTS